MLRDLLAAPSFSVHRAASGSIERCPEDAPIRNELLLALPAGVLTKVRPFLETVWIADREELFDAGARIEHVYFPETAVVSLVRVLRHGGDVEVGTAGREGMVGLSVALGGSASPVRARTQMAGTARRMTVRHLARLMSVHGAFPRVIHRYGQAFLTQSAQTTACNGAHLVQERCARWLLATRDRVGTEVFPLGAEPLAQTLGVKQAAVTAALRAFQDAGLVGYEQGVVTIRDHACLERVSCECYAEVRSHFAHIFPPAI
jgi:CRP-like cAMP-binding protein